MKAVKINMGEKSASKIIKAIITGAIVNIILVLLATVILSLMMVVSGSLFEGASRYLMLIPLALGGYTGGYVAARINKANGLLIGLISGAVVFIILLILSFAISNGDITYMFLAKLASVLLPAAIGGIKGVNKKEKLKIR